MILLDTNVVSEMMREASAPQVVGWLDAQRGTEVFVPVIAIAEIEYGICRMAEGRRRERLGSALAELLQILRGRIVAFDLAAAHVYGRLVAERMGMGRPIGLLDAQIAATARAHEATLATRNTRDFEGLGISLVNPFEHHP
jgi:predicted nucleic acid-binding protein